MATAGEFLDNFKKEESAADFLDRIDVESGLKPGSTRRLPLGVMDKFVSLVDSFGRGVERGFTGMLGLPVDIVNSGLGYLGLNIDKPFGGSESMRGHLDDLAKKIDLRVQKQGGKLEQLVERVGEEIGATVVPVGVTLRAANKAARVIPKQSGAFKAAGRSIVDTVRSAPGKTTAAEFGLAATGGLGAGIAQQASDSPLYEMAGQLAGSFAPAAVMGTGRATKAAIQGIGQNVSARQAVKNQMSVAVVGGKRRALEALNSPDAEFATTAQLTNDPGLLALERSLARSSGEAAGRFAEKRSVQNQFLRGRLASAAPEANVGDMEVRRALQKNIDKILRDVDDAVKAAVPEGQVMPDKMELSNLSIEIRNKLLQKLTNARNKEAELWLKIGGEDIDVDLRPLKSTIREYKNSLGKIPDPDSLPKVANDVIGTKKVTTADGDIIEVPKLGDAESLDELIRVRKRILNERRMEYGKEAPNFQKIHGLNEMDDNIMAILDNLDETMVKNVAEYHAARDFSKDLNNRFTRGSVAKVLSKDVTGAESIPPSEAGGIITQQRGGREASEQFISAAGGDKELMGLANDYIIKDFLNKNLTADNTLAVNRAKLWIANHADALNNFPESKAAITRILQKNEVANSLIDKRARTQRFIERSAASEYLGRAPEKTIGIMLDSKNGAKSAQEIMQFIGDDPEAVMGFRRHLWDGIVQRMELGEKDMMQEAFLSPHKMKSMLQKNESVLKAVYPPEHIKNIKEVYRQLEIANRSVRPGLPGGSDTMQNASGITIPQILGRGYNVKRGVVSKTFVVMEGSSRVINNLLDRHTAEQARILLIEALIDPKVGADLIKKVTPVNEAKVAQRLHFHLLNIAKDDDETLEDGGYDPDEYIQKRRQ